MTLKEYLSNIIEWHALDIDESAGKENLEKYPLDKQIDFIKDKYETYPMTYERIRHYVDDNEESQVERTMAECVYIKIPNVRIRSRRYIQMGSYYVRIEMPEDKHEYPTPPEWTIHSRYMYEEEGDFSLVNAWHPHIDTNAKPCQGSHGAMIATAFKNCNFVMAIQLIKKFLNSYYGRSVYHPIRDYSQAFNGQLFDREHKDSHYDEWRLKMNYEAMEYQERVDLDKEFWDKYVSELGAKDLFEETMMVPSAHRMRDVGLIVEGQDVKRIERLAMDSLKLERWEIKNSSINGWCWYMVKKTQCSFIDAYIQMLIILHNFRQEIGESIDLDEELMEDFHHINSNGSFVISFDNDRHTYSSRRIFNYQLAPSEYKILQNTKQIMPKKNINLLFPKLLSPGMNQYWEGLIEKPKETSRQIAKHLVSERMDKCAKGLETVRDVKQKAYTKYLGMLRKELRRVENVTRPKTDDNSGIIEQVALFS